MKDPGPRGIDRWLGGFFFVAWLVPITCTAFLGYPSSRLPPNLRDFYSISCLFDDRSDRFTSFAIQIRHADSVAWEDLDEDEFFPMRPFGHRSRFDRLFGRFLWREHRAPDRQELAEWIARRHAVLHPHEPPITVVRFVAFDTHIDEQNPPTGHFRKAKPSEIHRGRLYTIGKACKIPARASSP